MLLNIVPHSNACMNGTYFSVFFERITHTLRVRLVAFEHPHNYTLNVMEALTGKSAAKAAAVLKDG